MAQTLTIAERLERDTRDALRGGQKVRLGALRRARATLQNAEIAAGGTLDEEGAQRALRSLVKQHGESIAQFTAGGRDDLVAREREELAVIEEYLPPRLDEDAIAAIVAEVIAEEGARGPGDLGQVMRPAMSRAGGRADGNEVRKIAQRLLEERA